MANRAHWTPEAPDLPKAGGGPAPAPQSEPEGEESMPPQPTAPAHTRSILPIPTAPPQGKLTGRSVLIVDDDADIRASLNAALTSEGARTIVCGDGNMAVDMTLKHKPDMVLLDMMLPGRSGFLVLERIKGYEDSPLVIMITANEGKRHKGYAEGLGADLYLQKPLSLDYVIDQMRELFKKADAARA